MAYDLSTSGTTFGTGIFGQGFTGGTPPSVASFQLPATYTVEFRTKTTQTQLGVAVAFASSTNDRPFYVGTHDTGVAVASVEAGPDLRGTTIVNNGADHHIALVVTPTGSRLYTDGKQEATGNGSSGSFNKAITIGALAGLFVYSGVIDEVRISNIERYTGTFTPSSTSFTGDANTLALYHLDGNGVNSAVASTGISIKIGCIGDSITAGINGNPVQAMADYLTSVGYTPTMTNRGVSATTTQDWLPGGSYLPNAIGAFQSAGVTIVTIGLGTNDARTPLSLTPAQHSTNMASIVSALRAAGFVVVIHHPIWTLPNAGSTGQQWPADPNTIYKNYFAADMRLTDGVGVFAGDAAGFSLFGTNTSYLADGIHPTSTSNPLLGQLWAFGLLYRYGAAGISRATPVYRR